MYRAATSGGCALRAGWRSLWLPVLLVKYTVPKALHASVSHASSSFFLADGDLFNRNKTSQRIIHTVRVVDLTWVLRITRRIHLYRMKSQSSKLRCLKPIKQSGFSILGHIVNFVLCDFFKFSQMLYEILSVLRRFFDNLFLKRKELSAKFYYCHY